MYITDMLKVMVLLQLTHIHQDLATLNIRLVYALTLTLLRTASSTLTKASGLMITATNTASVSASLKAKILLPDISMNHGIFVMQVFTLQLSYITMVTGYLLKSTLELQVSILTKIENPLKRIDLLFQWVISQFAILQPLE